MPQHEEREVFSNASSKDSAQLLFLGTHLTNKQQQLHCCNWRDAREMNPPKPGKQQEERGSTVVTAAQNIHRLHLHPTSVQTLHPPYYLSSSSSPQMQGSVPHTQDMHAQGNPGREWGAAVPNSPKHNLGRALVRLEIAALVTIGINGQMFKFSIVLQEQSQYKPVMDQGPMPVKR